MTYTATSVSGGEKAEYACFFNLFERLVSRRSRGDNLVTSQELKPLFERLYAADGKSKVVKRPRREKLVSIDGYEANNRNIVNTTHSSVILGIDEENDTATTFEDEDDIESLAKFPLANARRYPFTFRLMVHKLYKKEEWARTIKDMLEKSKNDFKPLAEMQRADAYAGDDLSQRRDKTEAKNNVIPFKTATSPTSSGRRGSGRTGRQRSQSVTGTAFRKVLSPTSPTGIRSPGGIANPVQQPDVRVLKKRCVGRRKSMSGSLNRVSDTRDRAVGGSASASKHGGSWVYDAAISSAEHPIAAAFVTFPPGPPLSPTSAVGRYESMVGKSPSEMQGRTATKRRVSNGGEVPLLMPLQQVTNNGNGLAARRLARTIYKDRSQDESQELKKPTKRPLTT